QVDSMRLEQRIRFMTNLGTMRELGHTTEGRCEMVETHVIIDSPEPEEKIKGLLDEAEGACMAHFALRNPVPWSTRLVHNGQEVISRQG
ncbi:MAG: OsmC family peroxiredoxin, partial [Pseudomonadota bacterium]